MYFDTNEFTGVLTAFGGTGFQNGAAGTIFLKTNWASLARVLVDNGGNATTNATTLNWSGTADVTIQGGARASGMTSFRSLTIGDQSALALTGMSQTLTVSGDARIEAGGEISMDGMGYGSGAGPAAGRYYAIGSDAGSGGGGGGFSGYGGHGLHGATNAAGGAARGLTGPGSGGGGTANRPGGAGGGYLSLNVRGMLQLDGWISANGLSSRTGGAGGGGGGMIFLSVGHLTASGVVSANGGDGHLPNGGGGGGGEVVVTYGTNTFAGTITARGGGGYQPGGAGTILLGDGRSMQITCDNGGVCGANTRFVSGNYSELVIRGGAVCVAIDRSFGSAGRLFVGSNSWLRLWDWLPSSGVRGDVNGDAIIEAGGGISASGGGYTARSSSSSCNGRYQTASAGGNGGGGGHGGWGGDGAAGGRAAGGGPGGTYLIPSPNSLGGGGGVPSYASTNDSRGGGTITLTVRGQLKLDGMLLAEGNAGLLDGAGGGAGGSIHLTVGGLAGSGVISADGGDGHWPNGGGGGGGRVAVHYGSNSFTGTISAKGGHGFVGGGAGTIYLRDTNLRDSPVDQSVLLVDNGGLRGTNTPVSSFSPAVPLVVRGGATVIPEPHLTLPGLQVWSESAVVVSNQILTVQGDALVQAGGNILADGMGEKPGTGTGAGLSGVPAGGGSHGGFGGANSRAQTSGSVVSPTTWGSGGGGSDQRYCYGGSGGGSARLSVTGTLLVDGRISANGTDGQWCSGGGAGGSINLTVGTLAGSGTISANGGRGDGPSGGGGGGRVAVRFGTNLFAGAVTAFGGAGGAPGGAGTVYWEQTGASNAWLVINNGGLRGTNTPLSSLPTGLHLIVADGAVANPQTSLPLFRSVTLADGGLLTGWPWQTNLHVVTLGDLVIEPGGALSVSGLGHRANSGRGAGQRLAGQGSGGGHGGTGGASVSGAAGGGRYDSATQPAAWGSGGGAVFPPGSSLVGSAGGGALRLSVAGALVVNGQLSADGEDAWADDAGGGAGGSVWINANALTGGGLISARGGEAEWFNGGGGGGGRVALYTPVNTFTGLVSVAGGPGAVPGRAGTLFTSGMVPELEVLYHWPAGVVTGTVNQVRVTFTDAVDPASVATQDFTLLSPDGVVSNLYAWVAGPAEICVSFLARSQPGRYRLLVVPDIAGLVAPPMCQVYEGEFEVALPVVAGRVTNALGQGVAGVTLHPGGALPAATTDAEGRYAIGVPVGWSGEVVPVLEGGLFVPGRRAYTNVTDSVTGQDYLVFEDSAPTLEAGVSGTNVWLNWFGLPGVSYQVLYSTNLTDWYPWGGVLSGTNGPMQWRGTVGELPAVFFRLKAGN